MAVAPAEPHPTRQALIDTALNLFARQGFDGTSTREIAASAGANIGSISYHFGGKEGLRKACAEQVAGRIAGVAGAEPLPLDNLPPDTAATMLETMLERVLRLLLLEPQARTAAAFIFREISDDSTAIDHLFRNFLEPTHRQACAIWSRATGMEAESEATKLQVFSLIGQGVYFLVAGPLVIRRLGWETLGPGEVENIYITIRNNLRAAITAARKEHLT